MRLFAIVLGLILSSSAAIAEVPAAAPLKAEMKRIGVKMAVVVPAASIDEYPLWSSDSRYVYANITSNGWWKVDLNSVVLAVGTHHGRAIGVLQKGSTVSKAEESEVEVAKKGTSEISNVLSLKDGTKIQWEQNGSFGSRLSLKAPQKAAETLWETDMSVCGYVIPSPDSTMVTIYCEGTGFIVLQLK
jgi:hypothetical protein